MQLDEQIWGLFRKKKKPPCKAIEYKGGKDIKA